MADMMAIQQRPTSSERKIILLGFVFLTNVITVGIFLLAIQEKAIPPELSMLATTLASALSGALIAIGFRPSEPTSQTNQKHGNN